MLKTTSGMCAPLEGSKLRATLPPAPVYARPRGTVKAARAARCTAHSDRVSRRAPPGSMHTRRSRRSPPGGRGGGSAQAVGDPTEQKEQPLSFGRPGTRQHGGLLAFDELVEAALER